MRHLLLRCVPALVFSIAVTVVLTSVTQSLFNLWALHGLDAGLGPADWAETIAADLMGFTPLMAILAGAAFIVAFPVAAAIVAGLLPARHWVFPLAGASAILAALLLVNHLTPPPTLIAATRGLAGKVAFMICGAVGGLLYATLSWPRDPDLIID